MFEGLKTAVQYGLTYKNYAVCMGDRKLIKITQTQTFNFFQKCLHRYKLLIKKLDLQLIVMYIG